MISNILTKIFGSRNERLLKQYGQVVRQINALEPAVSALTDDELRGKTATLRERVANGEELDSVLPEAFAIVREAGKRTLQMRHFDMQLIGGMVLHYGKIAEMRTGEGKTLVATLPVYLNALAGRGVHLVTVNDYLAQRDADWKRRLNYAIVDEVDSILIDEARTPLIISGQADDNVDLYYRLNDLAPKLLRQADEKGSGDYWVDEKAHQVLLSEEGHEHAE